MAYTEFFVQPTGSNLNAGSTADNAAPFTYAGGTFVRSTGVFTVASGNPLTDGVLVGHFASIYTTAGATVATFVGRVTARDATTVTVDLTAIAGAVTTVDEGAGAATCKVGGAWAGPSGAVGFPFGFVVGTLNDGTNLTPRVNFKGGTAYGVTAAITADKTFVHWQGYTTTVGDGGKAIIDGGATGACYTLFTPSGTNQVFCDLIWDHNGNSGATNLYGLNLSGARISLFRCVCCNMYGTGFYAVGNAIPLVECEAYGNNISNNATNRAGFYIGTTGVIAIRCRSHHNAGSNAHGFVIDQKVTLINCIADSNGGVGIQALATEHYYLLHCDTYNNGSHGLHNTTAATQATWTIQNCNFVKNGGYGISSTATAVYGYILNCGFGAGTQANASGAVLANLAPIEQIGSVTYADDVTPWVDPANGDFRINLAAAENAGRGAFTQTYATESARNTVGYPDIGSAQRLSDYPAESSVLDTDTVRGAAGTIATRTLSAANDTVAAGYYAATTLSAVDADLAAANIVSGKTIFGVAGSASGGSGGGMPVLGGSVVR